jgi:hypothetical protein
VIEETFIAGRFPFGPDALDGGVLLLETAEELLPARHVGWIVRALGERGILGAVAAVLVARPQWIVPHGGTVMVDGAARRVTADYS